MASEWTDELRQKAVELYEEGNPTEENTLEVLKSVADTIGKTVNGTRMILIAGGVYIAKSKTTATTTTTSDGKKVVKKSKKESLDDLKGILEDNGAEVDASIVDKLTGKAAEYFHSAIKTIITQTTEE